MTSAWSSPRAAIPPLQTSAALSAVQQSARLHERVRAFAARVSGQPGASTDVDDTFDTLAVDIARFQATQSQGFARLVTKAGSSLSDVASIPAVPSDVFRLTRVAVHPPDLDEAVFETSGTTGGDSGRHPVRDLATYEALAVRLGERTLFSGQLEPAVVVALAPHPGAPPRSSLGHMMQLFMERFDGRALATDPRGLRFQADAADRWLASRSGVDVPGLVRACKIARHRREALFVLATSFALVALLDALDGDLLPAPERCVVMMTGGFKGRTREVAVDELRRAVAKTFGMSERNLVSEYGMTELTSQLYEARGRPGLFYPPPWLRVSAVDPATLEPVAAGAVGLARFVDLGNVDSAIAVQTEDRVRLVDGGIELLGRAPSARIRGCSLPFEGLIAGPPKERSR